MQGREVMLPDGKGVFVLSMLVAVVVGCGRDQEPQRTSDADIDTIKRSAQLTMLAVVRQ